MIKIRGYENVKIEGKEQIDIMGLNDTAWERLFDKYHILDKIEHQGQFTISAAWIKEFREPRLMTKFDHKINLPEIFAENHLAILPVTRGDYVISTFYAYEEFPLFHKEPQRISIPSHLQTLSPKFLVSEAIALNCANACGILADFLEEDQLVSTVSGRMSSGAFEFYINTEHGRQMIGVSNSQIEIDAAYEGTGCLALFEAKRDLSEDFLVRQIYYPMRVWANRITKPVKPVFLVYSNGIFHLYQYWFEDAMHYNSLRLVKQKSYAIATEITLLDIENLIKTTALEQEPSVAFPQANSMARIINLIELLYGKSMTRQDITTEYAFDERQTNYYTDAGRYLDFIEKGTEKGVVTFWLSDLGRHIMELGYRERQLAIVTQILKHKAFRETLKLLFKCGEMPDTRTVVEIMKQSQLFQVKSESTFVRRSSTVVGWIRWILNMAQIAEK